MKLLNLTPHEIHIVDCGGNAILTVPPSGTVARCTTARETVGALAVWRAADGTHNMGMDEDYDVDIPVTRTRFGAVEGLPDQIPGVFCIVSSVVAQAARHRQDLLIPDDTVRDSEGRIVGCRSLALLGDKTPEVQDAPLTDLHRLLSVVLTTDKELRYNAGEYTVNPKWQLAVEALLIALVPSALGTETHARPR